MIRKGIPPARFSSERMASRAQGAYALDIEQVFRVYEPGPGKEPVAKGTKVWHVHLYVADLVKAHDSTKPWSGIGKILSVDAGCRPWRGWTFQAPCSHQYLARNRCAAIACSYAPV